MIDEIYTGYEEINYTHAAYVCACNNFMYVQNDIYMHTKNIHT